MGLCSSNKSIDDIEYKDTTPFIPPVSEGKVIKVYDGDTITIASKMPQSSSINAWKLLQKYFERPLKDH